MWKNRLLASTEEFKHPAWGVSHSQRIYELSLLTASLLLVLVCLLWGGNIVSIKISNQS
jgi:hypothetical protein